MIERKDAPAGPFGAPVAKIAKNFGAVKNVLPPPLPAKTRNIKEASFTNVYCPTYTADLRRRDGLESPDQTNQPMVFSPSRKALNLPPREEAEKTEEKREGGQISNDGDEDRQMAPSRFGHLQKIYFGGGPQAGLENSHSVDKTKPIGLFIPKKVNKKVPSFSIKKISDDDIVQTSNQHVVHMLRNPTLSELLVAEKREKSTSTPIALQPKTNLKSTNNNSKLPDNNHKTTAEQPVFEPINFQLRRPRLDSSPTSMEVDSLQAIEDSRRTFEQKNSATRNENREHRSKSDGNHKILLPDVAASSASKLSSRTLLNLRHKQPVKSAVRIIENVNGSSSAASPRSSKPENEDINANKVFKPRQPRPIKKSTPEPKEEHFHERYEHQFLIELDSNESVPEVPSRNRKRTSSTRENVPTRAPPSRAYPDHPERDSLDGNLPGSSHGTGNPPPPPAPPRPDPPLDSAKPLDSITSGGSGGGGNGAGPSGFIKGPNASKIKKAGRKLKSDTDGSTMGEEDLRDNLSPLEKKHVSKKVRDFNSGFLGVSGMRDRDFDGPGGYRSMKEPYMYLWTVMSGMYGKLVVLLMLAFCLTEVLENNVEPFTFQGIFLIYLYVGSIFAIICIYTSVIMENCPSISASKENLTKPGDPEVGSITSFGTLKRAHISRSKTSRTSFYLRVGALVFGLVTLIFNGLEIAMHSTMREDCAQDVMFAHPIMQALFTFLQMHFLFVNSEVVVEKFGQIARFAFMHLVATNLAIWVRMIVWESANDWIHATYANKNVFDIPWPAQKVLHLHSCYHNNTLGRLWTSSQEQFFPFLIEYSLIAAAVTYIMWRNVGKEHLRSLSQLSKSILEETMHEKRGRKGHWKVDCRSASKGLFLGLLVLVGGIVILIIFFVMKDQDGFKDKMFWMVNGSQIVILTLSITSCLVGFWQIPKLAVSSTKPLELDRLLLSCTIVGAYIFAIFGMIVGGLYFHDQKMLTIFCTNGLLFLQVSLQGMLVAEASRRTCATRLQQLVKPGRQVITFLLFSNVTLWILDSFITHSALSQEFQAGFYGTLAWGIISRISLPLLILYRFHSAVILVEIWKNTYRTKAE